MRALFLVPLLLVTGCDTSLGSLGGTTDPADLRLGDPWVAVEAVVDGERVAFPAEGYTMTVRATTLGGRIPPNGYGAQHFDAHPDGSIEIREIVTTLALGSPEEMRLGDALMTSLRTARRFEVTGNALALHSTDGDGIRFRR